MGVFFFFSTQSIALALDCLKKFPFQYFLGRVQRYAHPLATGRCHGQRLGVATYHLHGNAKICRERKKGVKRGERAKFTSVGSSNFQNYSYLIPSSLTATPTQTSLCTIASAADFSNTEKPPRILATPTIFRSLVFCFFFLFFFLSFPFFLFRLAIAHSQKFIRLR